MINILVKASVSFIKQGTVPVPDILMYQIVSKTDQYSHFIPWCSKSIIKQSLSPNTNLTELQIAFNTYKQSYTSKVKSKQQKNHYLVHSISKQQPLSFLDSQWHIQKSLKNKCDVKYTLEFQFDSFVYRMASNMFLDYMGQQMWNIFQKRATEIYKEELKQLSLLINQISTNNEVKQNFKSQQIMKRIYSIWKIQNKNQESAKNKILKQLQNRIQL